MNEAQTWVNIGVTAILALTNIGLFVWQRTKIKWYESFLDKLEKQIAAIDKDLDTYKKMVNLDEMEKAVSPNHSEWLLQMYNSIEPSTDTETNRNG